LTQLNATQHLDIMHVVPYISINMLHRRFEQMLHRLIICKCMDSTLYVLNKLVTTSQTSLTTQADTCNYDKYMAEVQHIKDIITALNII